MKQKHDTWEFSGSKAMNGTFNNGDAVVGDSVILPYTTTLPDTAHGLATGSLTYIEGSTNYNGLRKIKTASTNAMLIYAKYVEEELAGTETWKTMFTYDDWVGSDLRIGSPWEFLGFDLTLDGAAATVANFTITVDAQKGAAWNNLIYSKAMNTVQWINNMFDEPRKMAAGNKINFEWANANADLWGLTVYTRRLV